jgi:hypothetical protein
MGAEGLDAAPLLDVATRLSSEKLQERG